MESQHKDLEIAGSESFLSEQRALIERLAAMDAPVLITGETGVGKELVARIIHMKSAHSGRAFVTLSGSDLDHALFAASHKRHPAPVVAPDTGTLFLDDVSDLSETAQAGVLKLLQSRPGGDQTPAGTARILASAGINLQSAVDTGRFRSDLFYRLNEFSLHIKPLRERREDIPVLVNHFISRFNKQYGKKVARISDAALAFLKRYNFPGNVRELRNMIQNAVLLNDRKVIWIEDLPIDLVTRSGAPLETGTDMFTLKQVELRHIQTVLEYTTGNVSRAARILGISRATLYDKIKTLDPGRV